MELSYKEKVFRELRIYTVFSGEKAKTKSPAAAVTLMENLKSVGYIMTPEALKRVIEHVSPDGMKVLQDDIISFAGDVKAEPMYPNFPQEVLDMDEAQYRADQLCHYFSTYGIELITGRKVDKGWLPHDGEAKEEKAEFNGFSADLKKIDVVFGDDCYLVPVQRILSRRNRMTPVEAEIVEEAVSNIPESRLASLSIPFKENVYPVFMIALKAHSFGLAKASCQHTGDVLKCTARLLSERKHKLKTSEKKFIVKLIERYPDKDFRENLYQSAKRGAKMERILSDISYSRFSRNSEHMKAVNDLRDGRLESFMSEVEKYISLRSSRAVELLATRPGMLLRSMRRLVGLGYNEAEIVSRLCSEADQLSTATLVQVMQSTELTSALVPVLMTKLMHTDTPLKGKKVYVDEQNYDLVHSYIGKTEEGGYVRSGMAFRIPETAGKIRFFIYWNDKSRVDLDLHSVFDDISGNLQHVGWNGDFKDLGVVTSGDITHSDAAEYIDIDMSNTDLHRAALEIHLFSGADGFDSIEETLAGVMGIKKLGANIALYDPKSCFVSQKLTSAGRSIIYGIIDVHDRYLRYAGESSDDYGFLDRNAKKLLASDPSFTVRDYLNILLTAQDVETVSSREEADLVLSVAKGGDVSLIDENFFQDL